MKWMKTFLWMIVFLFAIHFSLQNKDQVSIRYAIQNFQWFDFPKVPLFLVILCSFSLGVLIGGIGDLYGRIQLRRRLRQNQKIIQRFEEEIRSLRGPGLERPPFLTKEG
jgi:uncharacterized integral membrane protein